MLESELAPIAIALLPIASDILPTAMVLGPLAFAVSPTAIELRPLAVATSVAPHIAGSFVALPLASLHETATSSAKLTSTKTTNMNNSIFIFIYFIKKFIITAWYSRSENLDDSFVDMVLDFRI